MPRLALEIADIFRAHGPAWRSANVGHLSLGQLLPRKPTFKPECRLSCRFRRLYPREPTCRRRSIFVAIDPTRTLTGFRLSAAWQTPKMV